MKLVVYGTLLQPSWGLDIDETEHRIPGQLYDVGAFPVAVPPIQDDDYFMARIANINAADLPLLDQYESVDSGLFIRETITVDGNDCFIYLFTGELPVRRQRLISWFRYGKDSL